MTTKVATNHVSSPNLSMQQRHFVSDYCSSASKEPEFRRVVLGLCTNMQLDGFVSLECLTPSTRTLVESGCELLLDATNAHDKSIAEFVAALAPSQTVAATWPRKRTMATRFRNRAAWRLLGGRVAGRRRDDYNASAALELVGASTSRQTGTRMLHPIILAPPTAYLHTRARRTNLIEGPAGFALRAGGVAAVYQLYFGPGHALYLCVRSEGRRVADYVRAAPEPCEGETLDCFVDRVVEGGGDGDAPDATLVYCMVNCAEQDWWKFCGVPTQVLLELYMHMLQTHAFCKVTDAKTTSLMTWQFMRVVLPLIHMDTRVAFRRRVVDDEANRSIAIFNAHGGDPSAS